MKGLDWAVLGASLLFIVGYGTWRSRKQKGLEGYLLAGRSQAWWTVALSIMATQASAITFLSTPGQAFADGMRFVQFYFGLPVAMVILCVTVVPLFHRLKVYTAYEYLEGRFDAKTRTLTASLFLLQRGLACGLTIYAPALVLSVLLGWSIQVTTVLIGSLVVVYTATGGAKAVNETQTWQMGLVDEDHRLLGPQALHEHQALGAGVGRVGTPGLEQVPARAARFDGDAFAGKGGKRQQRRCGVRPRRKRCKQSDGDQQCSCPQRGADGR